MINLCVFCKNRYSFEQKLIKAIEANKKIIVICHNETQKNWIGDKIKDATIVTKILKKYEDDTFDMAFLMADSRSGNAVDHLNNVKMLGKLRLGMLVCNAKIHKEKELPITPEEVIRFLSNLLQNSNGKSVCGVKVKNVQGVKGGRTIDTSDPGTIAKITEIVKENKSKTFFNMDLSSELRKLCKQFVEIDFT